jgi:hypothetical protein
MAPELVQVVVVVVVEATWVTPEAQVVRGDREPQQAQQHLIAFP